MKKTAAALMLFLCLSAVCGCGIQKEVPSASRSIFAMDTYMNIVCYGERCEEAAEASVEEIRRLEAALSVGNESGEIAQINENGAGTVSEDAAIMIEKALELHDTTEGAFDISVYPLMELWGFTTQNFSVPETSELETVLSHVDADEISFDAGSKKVELGNCTGIDLGAIAKGYTSSRIMEIFEEYDLVSGNVSLGGNVQCYKTKTDGSPWRIGIVDPNSPDDTGKMLGTIKIVGKAVITSGAYERNFTDEKTGKKYHHIIDPTTGYPSESGLISVSIVSENGMLADALSTSCYIMGLEKSIDYWRIYGEADGFGLILMDDENEVYVTEDIAEDFSSDYHVTVITKKE